MQATNTDLIRACDEIHIRFTQHSPITMHGAQKNLQIIGNMR